MYIRESTVSLIDKNGKFNAGGCNTYMFFNQSNVNCTINGVLVLRPNMFWAGPTENPDIQDHTVFEVQFDMLNTPIVVQPDTGPKPVAREYVPGDPPPARDTRLIVFQSYLKPMTK